MLGSGDREVSEGSFESGPVRHRQRAASCIGIHGDQYTQEMFYSPVTVAQQAERFIEVVIRTLTDLECHSFLSIECSTVLVI
jgi:hypothetical protein